MIRTILTVLFVILYCVVSIPVLIVETIIRKFNPMAAEMSMLHIVQGAFKIVLLITGTKVTTLGYENVPDDEAVLFVGNHLSFFDTIISYSQMKTRCGYIAKDNLAHIPILSWNMRFLFCLFLDRSDLKQGLETIRKAIDYVKNGISVFIYPEGTRNKGTDPLLEFHSGSFKIAEKTGCPIVPVCITNSNKVFEDQLPKIKRTTVYVEYLPAIDTTNLTKEEKKELSDRIRGELENAYTKNSAL